MEEGFVAHKSVTGVKDNTSYTILVNRPADREPQILVEDEDYKARFSPDDQNAVIGESLEMEMRQKYSEISYLVNVRLTDEDEGTQPYRVSRQIFNKLRIGSRIRFRATATKLPEIIELLEQPGIPEAGVLEGTITIGPIWPVEPPGGNPPIPTEVYKARKVLVYDEHRTKVIEKVNISPSSDGDYGYYWVKLDPGMYIVDINHVGIDSSSDVPGEIEIKPGQTIEVNIDIDTGIR